MGKRQEPESAMMGRTMGMGRGGRGSAQGMRMMHFKKGRPFEVTSPEYDAQTGKETVNLISLLKDESDKVVGTLEVTVRFRLSPGGRQEIRLVEYGSGLSHR